MKIRLTLDKKTKTILFYRPSQGSSPLYLLPNTEEKMYRGEVPHNMLHSNCNEFFYDGASNIIQAWRDQNEDADRCSVMKTKCRSLMDLHQRITDSRMKASNKLGYIDVFQRTQEEAKAFVAGNGSNLDQYPFLKVAAEAEAADALSVAKAIIFKGSEYDALLLQLEKLRLKWVKGVLDAKTTEDVIKIKQTMKASTLLD